MRDVFRQVLPVMNPALESRNRPGGLTSHRTMEENDESLRLAPRQGEAVGRVIILHRAVKTEQLDRNGSLILQSTALDDHKFLPSRSVVRFVSTPREECRRDACVCRAGIRRRPAAGRANWFSENIADGLAFKLGSSELLRREVRPRSLESV